MQKQPTQVARRAAERRYLTVMFVDMVGFTALSDELDPEDLHALTIRYQQLALAVMERFGGFVANFLGDGVLVYFGYPTAHGNDAERSLRAGLELIERISKWEIDVAGRGKQPIAARIGVHSGPVIVGLEVMSAGPISHGVVGKAANLAARLQNEAPVNGVVVSRETMEIVEGLFRFAPLGERRLKGLSGPVEVFQVIGPKFSKSGRGAALGASTFMNCEAELAALLTRWRTARDQSCAQVVVVAGEAGVGKSRFISEFLTNPELAGCAFVEAFCREVFGATAFFPIASYLRRRIGLAPEDDESARKMKVERLLAEYEMASAENTKLLAGLPGIAANDAAPTAEAALTKLQQIRLLVDLVGRAARDRPVVMCFEDVHWLDPSSSEFLAELVAGLKNTRLMVLLSTRGYPQVPALPSPDEVLRLGPLVAENCLRLAAQVPGSADLPEEAIARAIEASEGTPLFVEQLVRALVDEQKRARADRRPASTLPLVLAEILSERLDRQPQGRRAALAAACLGRSFKSEFLAAVLQEDPLEVAKTLGSLVDAKVMRPLRYGLELQFEFTHALLQRMAQDSMLDADRADMHRAIVTALRDGRAGAVAPELMAFHLGEAGMHTEAVEAWLAAAVQAARVSADREAIGHAEKGLALLAKTADEAKRRALEVDLLSVSIGSINVTEGPTSPTLLQRCERGQALCREGETRSKIFPFLFGQFTFHNCRGSVDEARALALMLLRESGEQSYEPTKVVGHRLLGMTLLGAGDARAATTEFQASLDLYAQARDVVAVEHYGQNARVHSQSLLVLSLFCLGEIDEALDLGRDVLLAVDDLRHPNSTALALSYVGCNLSGLAGAFDTMARAAERLLAVAGKNRLGGFHAHGEAYLGWALSEAGQAEEGLTRIARAVAAFDRAQYRLGLSMHLANLAQAQRRTGKGREAEATIARALEHMASASNGWYEPELLRIDATIAYEFAGIGREAMIQRLTRAADRARELGFPVFEQRCLLDIPQFGSLTDEQEARIALLSQNRALDQLALRLDGIVGSAV